MIFEAIILVVLGIISTSPIYIIINIIKDMYGGYVAIPIGLFIIVTCITSIGLGVYLWIEFFKFI